MRAPHRLLSTILLALTGVFLARPLFAQARQSASRAAGIDVFGAVSDTDTAFYGTDRHYGGMAGIDYTQFRYIPRYHALFTPTLELRGTYTSGTSVSESSIQGGLKLALNYHSLHPYADLLVGGGSITFNPAYEPPGQTGTVYLYNSDSSFLYVYGGGVSFDILPRWSLLADYQHQSWDLGFNPDVKFYPQAVSVGVVYHLRLKAFR